VPAHVPAFCPTAVLCLAVCEKVVAVAWGLMVAVGGAGLSAMERIWNVALDGDVDEMERLVGQDPGLLDARDRMGWTPLLYVSEDGNMGVVRWLLDKGAAINEREDTGSTALWQACSRGLAPVVRLLLERGADPAIANNRSSTPLMEASRRGHLEVVRSLLEHPSAETTINKHDGGATALWHACCTGRGAVVRALLEGGADPTIASNDGTTPMAIAKQVPPDFLSIIISAEGRRECVAALEVRLDIPFPTTSIPQ
jgi:uncharacterized protein